MIKVSTMVTSCIGLGVTSEEQNIVRVPNEKNIARIKLINSIA